MSIKKIISIGLTQNGVFEYKDVLVGPNGSG